MYGGLKVLKLFLPHVLLNVKKACLYMNYQAAHVKLIDLPWTANNILASNAAFHNNGSKVVKGIEWQENQGNV